MSLIAAIDQGTTSTRCLVFAPEGAPLASAQLEHRQIFPKPGWVEHDPLEIWRATEQVVRTALERAGASAASLAAVGITNQRETVVFWDRETGAPFGNAIVWQDVRTAELCAELARRGAGELFRARTGLPLATYFSALKIHWALERVSGLRAAAEAGRALCGTIDTWLVWQLTGGAAGGARHVVDVTNASRMQLMDLARLEWDEELLARLAIPRSMLPEIVPSSDASAFGSTRASGPFRGQVTIGGALGDQQAALFGQGCLRAGDTKNTYGTGCFLLQNTGAERLESAHGLLSTVAWRLGAEPVQYALEGSVAIAGALVQWLRDNFGLVESAAQIEELARTVEDNGDVYIVPAFSGLFAPRWRPDARGVFCGLTQHTHRGHVARAALEATAYQTREVFEALRADTGLAPSELRVDGGMTRNRLLMQFQADVLGLPVVCAEPAETTALGAALAAGLAVGARALPEAGAALGPARGARFEPEMPAERRERLYARWNQAVERSLGWVD